MKYSKTTEEHIQWARDERLCYQCAHPSSKGICSCGGWKLHKKHMTKMLKLFDKEEEEVFNSHVRKMNVHNIAELY